VSFLVVNLSIMQKMLSRTIAGFLITAVIAGTWDAWWHGAVGRDSFWEPPHLVLYSAVIVAILLGLYGWHQNREKIWRNLAIVLVLIPVSAPFDEIWHRIFGVEPINSPLIVWSPPHLLITGALTASFIMLLPLLKRDQDKTAKRFLGGFSFAAIISLLFFVAGPLQPTGPWELLGYWGAGIVAALLAGTLLIAQKWLKGFAPATLVALFLIVISSISFGEIFAPGVIIAPHDHPPAFLTIFSYLIPAVVIDLLQQKPLWLRGGLFGFIWSALLYGFSSRFFEPQFQYPFSDAKTAILASLIAGIVAGLIINNFQKQKI